MARYTASGQDYSQQVQTLSKVDVPAKWPREQLQQIQDEAYEMLEDIYPQSASIDEIREELEVEDREKVRLCMVDRLHRDWNQDAEFNYRLAPDSWEHFEELLD